MLRCIFSSHEWSSWSAVTYHRADGRMAQAPFSYRYCFRCQKRQLRNATDGPAKRREIDRWIAEHRDHSVA